MIEFTLRIKVSSRFEHLGSSSGGSKSSKEEAAVPQAPGSLQFLSWVLDRAVLLPGGPGCFLFYFVIWTSAALKTQDSVSEVSSLLDYGATYR